MKHAIKLILHGIVQGVGMRYYVAHEASLLQLNGYVKNMLNGTVLIVLEGEKESIERFMKALNAHGPGTIDYFEKEAIDVKNYKNFDIRY
ncbi:MAG: acylphosphatase [Candidatus Izemoplasmataceae bacterium]